MEEMRDSELEIAEIALEAAEAQLEAAEEQLQVAEEMLAFQVKNNQLMEEYLNMLDKAEETAKGLGKGLDDLLDGIDAELDDIGFENLGEELFTGIDSAVEETIQKISDAFAGLVEELQEIFEPLIPMWDRLGDVWAPIFETIIERLKPLETVVGGLKNIFAETMESVRTLADEVIMFLVNIGAIEMPKSFLRDLEDAKLFEGVFDGFNQPLPDEGVLEWGQGLQDRAQDIRDSMESPLADLGTRLQEPFQKMKEAILEVAQTIREVLGGAWQFIQQLVDEIVLALIELGVIEPFGKYIEEWEEIRRLQEEFSDQLAGGGGEPLAITWFQKIKKRADELVNHRIFKIVTAPFVAPLQAFWEQLTEKILPALKELSGPLGNLRDAIKDFFAKFSGEEGGQGEKIIKLWAFVNQLFNAAVLGVLSGIIRGLIGFVGGIINAVAALIDYLGFFIDFWLGLVDIVIGFWNIFSGNSEEGALQITEAVRGMWESLKGMFGAADDILVALVEGLVEALKGLFWGIVDTVIDAWDYFYDYLLGNSLIPDFVNGVIEWITNLVTTVVTAIWDFVLKIVSFFVKLYTDVIAAIVQFVLDIKQAWTDLITSIVEAIVGFVTDAETSFTDMITNIVDAIVQFVTDVVQAWIDLKDRVAEAVGTFVTDVVTAITEFKDKIKEKLLEIVDKALGWAKDIGQAIIDGLVSALTGGLGAVGDAISGIAGSALDKAKNIFGIDSPSKEFEVIGEQTLEGWIEGMQRQKAALQKIVESMVDVVIKTASELFDGLEKLWKKGGAVIVNETKDWLKAVLKIVIDWAKQMAANGNSSLFGKVFVSITRLLTNTAADFVLVLKRFFDVTLAATQAWAKEMALNDDRSLFGSVFDTIEVALENFWQDFMLVWDPFLLRVVDDTKVFADAMALDGEDSLWGSIFIAILDMFTIFEKVYTVAAELFFVSVKKWADDLQKIFTDKKSHFRGAGENLINALAAGMQAAAGHLYNVASNIANQVSSIIDDAYEITSPSRVFYKVGTNIVEGWARGMSDNESRLTDTMGSLADSVLALGGSAPAPQGVLGLRQMQASVLPAPVPAAGVITNAEVNMGGQVINNGMDQVMLQIALEQALRNVL
jgi:phage-related protein